MNLHIILMDNTNLLVDSALDKSTHSEMLVDKMTDSILENKKKKASAKEKKRETTFYLLLFMNFITNVSMSLIAPFFPDEAAAKGVSSNWVGFIFGILNVGAFMSSLVFGK